MKETPEKSDTSRKAAPHMRDAAETKKRILKEAISLFSRRTYESVSTRDIAAAAGINAALISRYFGSKRGLFHEVFQNIVRENRNTADSSKWKETIFQKFAEAFEEEAGGPKTTNLRLVLLSSLSPQVSDIVPGFFEQLMESVASAMPDDSQSDKVGALLATAIGFVLVFRVLQNADRPVEDSAVIQSHFRQMVEVLFTPTA